MLHGIITNSSRLHDYFSDVLKLRKHTFVVRGPWLSNLNFMATSDPANVHYILSTNFRNFNKGPAFKEIFEFLGDGVLAADSESWKMQRKLIHLLFRQAEFLRMVEKTIQKKVETGLLKILDHASDHGYEVDMQDMFQRLTLDITCTFILGKDLNSLTVNLPEVPFAKALDDIEEVMLHRHIKPKNLWKLQKWLRIGLERKATKALKTIDSFVHQEISHKQEQINKILLNEAAEEEGFDLITNFLTEDAVTNCQAMKKSVETFLSDSVLNILIAGRDTVATTLTWFFWLVSMNPLVESKIREEIQVTLRMKATDRWQFPNYQKLNELIYLHATLCETLRLYPPVPYNHKTSVEPDILPSGHHVNKESKIIISIYAMGRNEEIWGADSQEFRPERWISEKNTLIDMPTFKYNVFGAGPRACPGKDLAFREMKAVAAAVIWNYNIQVVKEHHVIPANSVVLHMQNGLKVNVAKNISSEH